MIITTDGQRATTLTIVARGHPAPQGSKRGIAIKRGGVYTGKVAMIESSQDRVRTWRQDVKDAAEKAMTAHYQATGTWFPLDGPLTAAITFTLPRPKSHFGTGRNAHILKPSAPAAPAGVPDLSKLLRATEDALTDAGVWHDDAQLVDYQRLAKCYPTETTSTTTLELPMFAAISGIPGADALPHPGALIRIRTLGAVS